MPKVKDEVVKITSSTMIKRGWTKKLIEEFYPEPYAIVKNPRYATAAPMKLYKLETVIEIESRADFKLKFDRIALARPARIQGAKKAVQTKTEYTLDTIRDLNIEVVVEPLAVVRKDAIEAYNDYQMYRGGDGYATKSDSRDFLDRITVNYIRHNLTIYDAGIAMLFNRVGGEQAYELLTRKVFEKIAQHYPSYAKECERQLKEKFDCVC